MGQWTLVEATDIDATLDDSGVYVVINRKVEKLIHKGIAGEVIRIRADLMDQHTQEPIVSFIGTANNVRKHLIAFMNGSPDILPLSYEHTSYIGYELLRAERTVNYVQD